MGIQGLLQALKPIQVKKHLQEYSGKTIAVDAYVWLHKGLYSCATELATGKKTHRYVDYAMHRVRLLKHYNIQPYIVFDGGPLPAKKRTEQERKQKRDEYLSKGNGLAAQGKHIQARECYVKCVDVTPQMAFQFIKALRAENTPYVVAPYEADAQLAYLEKIKVVDAIITEDSDLLVFGCKNVLYKLDVVDNTVVSICRDQFGSVTTSSDPNSISFYGWSDTQFRAMAILSGCDYLSSIPGIGLKTANSLLRKWKTAEQVVKVIAMEGKKSVPVGYWKEFQLAEMCFLYQRVYCPLSKKLVNLTDPGGGLNEEKDTYVGSDLRPALAEGIAVGDVCPISRLPMVDINPSYKPYPIQNPLPLVSLSPRKSKAGKGKGRESLPGRNLFDFFSPNAATPRPKPTSPSKPILTGKASGKRTLADVMDNDRERKKRLRKSPSPIHNQPRPSKFFAISEPRLRSMRRRHSEGELQLSSHHQDEANKENIMNVDEDDEFEASRSELEGSNLSVKAQVDASDVFSSRKLNAEEFPEPVEQMDGYISPSDHLVEAQDVSSPIRQEDDQRKRTAFHMTEDDDADFLAQVFSSPISVKRLKTKIHVNDLVTPVKLTDKETILAVPTPTPTRHAFQELDDVPSPTLFRGPDLRSMLGEESELDMYEAGAESRSTTPPTPSPDTPGWNRDSSKQSIDVDELEPEVEEQQWSEETTLRTKAVMDGWRRKWALPSLQARNASSPKVFGGGVPSAAGKLRRSETTVIMSARASQSEFYRPPKSAPPRTSIPKAAASKKKLVFESTNVISTTTVKASKTMENVMSINADDTQDLATGSRDVEAELQKARAKLSQYRFIDSRT